MTYIKIDNYKIFLIIILAVVTITLDSYFTTEYRFYDKVNAQTIENEIMANTLETVEKATAGIPEIAPPVNEASRSIDISTLNITEPIPDNSSQISEGTESALAGVGNTTEEAIKSVSNDSDISDEYPNVSGATLEEQLKLAQEKLYNQLGIGTFNTSKLDIDVGFPPVDFSNMLKNAGSLVSVEYQSASSVILRGDEETLLLVNGTLAPFWYAIDIVKKHGYYLKEITESGMGSQGNPTRFYAILEKDKETHQTQQTNTMHNNTSVEKKTANETLLVQNNTTNKDSLDTTSRSDEKQLQSLQQPSKENTTITLKDALPESKILKILSQDSYIDSIGGMHVIGEVKNNTPKVTQFVQIIGTFYDVNNKVVGTSFVYTTPTDLAPGEIAPFDLILSDASIPIEQIERYTLKISGQ